MPNESVISKERLMFLANEFEVFTEEEVKTLITESKLGREHCEFIKGNNKQNILAIKRVSYEEDKENPTIKVAVSERVFRNMIKADPTEQKANLSWLLHSFRRFIKENNISEAIRFADEDLRTANEYLIIFEANKRKKKFIEWAKKSAYRKWKMTHRDSTEAEWKALEYNPSDITQYKSLSQLFDSVDPFRERTASNLECAMQKFVELGLAEIPFRDRKWTVYVPLSMEANCVMEKLASWCTAKPGNGMFESYTNYKTPIEGAKSKIYVVISNDVFKNKSEECYQMHFESKQVKDRSNSSISLYECVLQHSEGMSDYFHDELDVLARLTPSIDNNVYIDYLISFGFTESLFDYLDENIPVIKLKSREVPKLPDISKFKNLDELLLMKLGLTELHPSIGNLTKLELMSISDNKIKVLPKEIGLLKNLDFLNIKGNPIEVIPDEIAGLDKKNGGKLYQISVDVKDIGEANMKKLKRLLPSTIVGG
jgi:hypothetical protein